MILIWHRINHSVKRCRQALHQTHHHYYLNISVEAANLSDWRIESNRKNRFGSENRIESKLFCPNWNALQGATSLFHALGLSSASAPSHSQAQQLGAFYLTLYEALNPLTLSTDYSNPFYFQSHTLAFHSQLQHVIPLPCINLCNAPL